MVYAQQTSMFIIITIQDNMIKNTNISLQYQVEFGAKNNWIYE